MLATHNLRVLRRAHRWLFPYAFDGFSAGLGADTGSVRCAARLGQAAGGFCFGWIALRNGDGVTVLGKRAETATPAALLFFLGAAGDDGE